MGTIEQIKAWADKGWTQEDCAQALGLTHTKFRYLYESLRGEWRWPRGKSHGFRDYIANRQPHLRKGTPESAEQCARMRAARFGKLPTYTVRGVTGTVYSLREHFGVTLAKASISYRIKKLGWSVEKALFTQPSDNNHNHWVNKNEHSTVTDHASAD